MSQLSMTEEEKKTLDSQIELKMDWARNNPAEAEQLALDAGRLLACSTDRLDRLKKQDFFARCRARLNGEAGSMERATVNDVIQTQKLAFRYISMLQERELLMAHSLLSLKNNLNSLAIKEEETRNLITKLAQRTLQRFEALEKRVDQVEISTNIQGWLLGLQEREYDIKYPSRYIRLFRVINDFYGLKNDNWNHNDLLFMRRAIRTVGLNPTEKLSLNSFINNLIDEIQMDNVGYNVYESSITYHIPQGIDNYSRFVIKNISSPVYVAIHGLNNQYNDMIDVIEDLQAELKIPQEEALKRLLRRSIARMNVNLDYEFPLAETAIEILGCIRLSKILVNAHMAQGSKKK